MVDLSDTRLDNLLRKALMESGLSVGALSLNIAAACWNTAYRLPTRSSAAKRSLLSNALMAELGAALPYLRKTIRCANEQRLPPRIQQALSGTKKLGRANDEPAFKRLAYQPCRNSGGDSRGRQPAEGAYPGVLRPVGAGVCICGA